MRRGGFPLAGIFPGIAYGWRAATTLATQGGTGDQAPTKNADSLALLASGK